MSGLGVGAAAPARPASPADCASSPRLISSTATLLKLRRPLVVPQEAEVQERAAEVAVVGECDVQTVQPRPHRISWARLLKRVFCSDIT